MRSVIHARQAQGSGTGEYSAACNTSQHAALRLKRPAHSRLAAQVHVCPAVDQQLRHFIVLLGDERLAGQGVLPCQDQARMARMGAGAQPPGLACASSAARYFLPPHHLPRPPPCLHLQSVVQRGLAVKISRTDSRPCLE